MDTSLDAQTEPSVLPKNTCPETRRRSAAEEDNTPWTATRCLRLLRPLESRITPLEKWVALYNSRTHEQSLKRKQTDVSSNPGSRLFQGSSPPDPVWIPLKRPRRKGAVYTFKSDHRDHTTAQSAILLPTPFRVRHHPSLVANPDSETSGKDSIPQRTEEASRHLVSRPLNAPERFPARSGRVSQPVKNSGARLVNEHIRGAELSKGIATGLENLLRKTRPPGNSESSCPSLFSTCLRKIPEYIKLEQTAQCAIDDDNDTDTTAEIYADLEDLGPTSAGWRPLREVVRAHGLAIVKDLLQNGTISGDHGAQMLGNLISELDLPESGALLTAYITGLCSGNSITMHQVTHFNEGLGAFLGEFGSTTSLAKLLRDLFTNGSLFPAWSGTRTIGSAARMWVRGLVRPESVADILGFYESITRVICSNPPTSRTQSTEQSYDSIQELLPVLTAMVLTGLEHTDNNRQLTTGLAIWTSLQTLAVEILADDPSSQCLDDRARHTRAVVLMANLVLAAVMHPSGDDFVRPDTKQLLGHLAQYCDSQQAICITAQSLTRLASCCGNQQSQASLAFLQNFLGELIKHMQSEAGPAKEFLQQVIIRASGDFAASDRSRQAVKYAWSVEAAVEEADPLTLDELCSAIKPRNRSHGIAQDTISQISSPHELAIPWQPAYHALCEDMVEQLDCQIPPAEDSELTRLPAGSSPSPSYQAVVDAHTMLVKVDAVPQNAEQDASVLDDSGYVSSHASSMKTPLRSKATILPKPYLESPDVLAPSVCEHSSRRSIHHDDNKGATVKRKIKRARSRSTKISKAVDHSDDDLA
ncbi:hypothetical protein MBLNU457_5096t1 [Dothideomycetes sp. NU457]